MNFYSASSSDESSSIAFVEFVQFTPLQPEQAAEHSIFSATTFQSATLSFTPALLRKFNYIKI